MKKIIAAFDGLRFSESTLEYAIYLAKQYDAHVTGVFLREVTKLGFALYETVVSQSHAGKNIMNEIDRTDAETLHQATVLFESRCEAAGVPYTIHRDRKNAVKELVHESVFADLLLVDAWETFSYVEVSMPGWFIRNVLHEAQCPVMVVPKKFHPVRKIVFLYDGTPSSMHAIKMFSYLLTEKKNLPTELLCAKHAEASLHLPDNSLLKEWMKRHFPKTEYKVLKGTEKELIALLANEDPGVLVVAGAYHRSHLSMWFRQSLANLLIRETTTPVFISHT
ncbi:MAG TPA: universal stress protein [Chitinophagaceae bacterium]|nr:universal stress protein [Chitinophagaceae bacterium]